MLFTPSLLFLFPALDPAFPRLDVNQAIALGLIVEFFGYSSAATAYWRQRRIAFEVAGPVLRITLPTASSAGLDWLGKFRPMAASFFRPHSVRSCLCVLEVSSGETPSPLSLLTGEEYGPWRSGPRDKKAGRSSGYTLRL